MYKCSLISINFPWITLFGVMFRLSVPGQGLRRTESKLIDPFHFGPFSFLVYFTAKPLKSFFLRRRNVGVDQLAKNQFLQIIVGSLDSANHRLSHSLVQASIIQTVPLRPTAISSDFSSTTISLWSCRFKIRDRVAFLQTVTYECKLATRFYSLSRFLQTHSRFQSQW